MHSLLTISQANTPTNIRSGWALTESREFAMLKAQFFFEWPVDGWQRLTRQLNRWVAVMSSAFSEGYIFLSNCDARIPNLNRNEPLLYGFITVNFTASHFI